MSRPSFVSVARYTSPIPPAPNGDWISYGPSFVPGVRAIGARNYSPCSTLHADATILDVWSATLPLSVKEVCPSCRLKRLAGGNDELQPDLGADYGREGYDFLARQGFPRQRQTRTPRN